MTAATSFTDYLAEHPDSAALLDALRARMSSVGPVTEQVSASQVAFRKNRRRVVAMAWAPGQYQGSGAPLVLTIGMAARDDSPRWKEVVERRGHFIHHLELHTADDIDDEVEAWLRAAWDAAG